MKKNHEFPVSGVKKFVFSLQYPLIGAQLFSVKIIKHKEVFSSSFS